MTTISAIIADDEDTLRDSLKRELNNLWPELVITGRHFLINDKLNRIS